MNKEVADKHTAFLSLPGGLNGIDYPQKFVKAKSEAPFSCNYAAEKVDRAKVMNETMCAKK